MCKLLISTNFRRARLSERCPFPTGVISGPFKPMPFSNTESIAGCGMCIKPSGPRIGVTSTGSHAIGVCNTLN